MLAGLSAAILRWGSPLSAKNPVRLKVAYKTPQSLVGELTRSVGRGGVRIEAHRALPVGTQFIFELKAVGLRESVEVNGEVISVNEASPGKWVHHIRYEPPKESQGLEAVISRIFEGEKHDVKRQHARVPLQVRAVEDKPEAPTYRLRDISRGGVGIDVEAEQAPAYITVGAPFLMLMRLSSGGLVVPGEVAWVVSTKTNGVHPRVGVTFVRLKPPMLALLDELLTLRALPAPPWIARLEFGDDAIRRMAE